MKFYNKSLMGILILLNLFACSAKQKPISYGQDSCHFCGMMIMDNKYAAEAVTIKGKIYKFDAIECMIQYIDKPVEQEYAYQLISDYSNPGELINAEQSIYLVSKNLPSPMGAFLSGFSSEMDAKFAMKENGGVMYNWEQIKEKIN